MNRESIEDLNLEDSKPNEVSQFNYNPVQRRPIQMQQNHHSTTGESETQSRINILERAIAQQNPSSITIDSSQHSQHTNSQYNQEASRR